MSGWEIYTWFAVLTLIVGPALVVVFSIRDLRSMWHAARRGTEGTQPPRETKS